MFAIADRPHKYYSSDCRSPSCVVATRRGGRSAPLAGGGGSPGERVLGIGAGAGVSLALSFSHLLPLARMPIMDRRRPPV